MSVQREKARVLIVDDQEANLIAFEAALNEVADEIVAARSGPEALSQVAESTFAVIVLDVMMPVMDGFETASLLRKHVNSRSTPIIFVTAGMPDENRTFQGYSLGAVDYLNKPISDRMLRSKVKVFVDLFRSAKELEQERLARVRERWEAERLKVEVVKERRNAETSALFRLFVESVMDYGVFTLDQDGYITTWNIGAERILGYPEGEALSRA